jgi:hypothetical protein
MKNKKNNNNKIYLQQKNSSNHNIGSNHNIATGTQTNTQGLNQPIRKTGASNNRNRAGSMLTIPTYTRKNLKLTNNVASLVKKYAAYIFN